jgi:23S rRNA pseudouridine1911/1915/1917 synthase
LIGPPIQKPDQEKSLLEWLSDRHRFNTPADWQALIESKKITINGITNRVAGSLLKQNDQVGRIHPLEEEPEVDTTLEVLWQDPDIAVVSKPSGLVMHESGYFRRKTVQWLLPKLLGADWLGVHRLDRETSGALICAKGRTLRSLVAKMFENGQIEKTYLAVSHGVPTKKSWVEKRPIIAASSPRVPARCVEAEEGLVSDGEFAETHFELLRTNTSLDDRRSLICAVPKTGRTHQIRVHLASAGLEVVGDKVNGLGVGSFEKYLQEGNTRNVQKLSGGQRHLLHAWKVRFTHPLTREVIEVTAPPGPDFDI